MQVPQLATGCIQLVYLHTLLYHHEVLQVLEMLNKKGFSPAVNKQDMGSQKTSHTFPTKGNSLHFSHISFLELMKEKDYIVNRNAVGRLFSRATNFVNGAKREFMEIIFTKRHRGNNVLQDDDKCLRWVLIQWLAVNVLC